MLLQLSDHLHGRRDLPLLLTVLSQHLSILLEHLGRSHDIIVEALSDRAADCVGRGLRNRRRAECIFKALIGSEEEARRGNRDEDYGADALIQTTVEYFRLSRLCRSTPSSLFLLSFLLSFLHSSSLCSLSACTSITSYRSFKSTSTSSLNYSLTPMFLISCPGMARDSSGRLTSNFNVSLMMSSSLDSYSRSYY
jgi:hypothetical protein